VIITIECFGIVVYVLFLAVMFMAAEMRRTNKRSKEINAAFKAFLIADLDCHWKGSAERLLRVLEKD